jgi:hypothetical protein
MSQQLRTQLDLFVTRPRPADLSGAERQKAVALLQVLLKEASKPPGKRQKEAGNE